MLQLRKSRASGLAKSGFARTKALASHPHRARIGDISIDRQRPFPIQSSYRQLIWPGTTGGVIYLDFWSSSPLHELEVGKRKDVSLKNESPVRVG